MCTYIYIYIYINVYIYIYICIYTPYIIHTCIRPRYCMKPAGGCVGAARVATYVRVINTRHTNDNNDTNIIKVSFSEIVVGEIIVRLASPRTCE